MIFNYMCKPCYCNLKLYMQIYIYNYDLKLHESYM